MAGAGYSNVVGNAGRDFAAYRRSGGLHAAHIAAVSLHQPNRIGRDCRKNELLLSPGYQTASKGFTAIEHTGKQPLFIIEKRVFPSISTTLWERGLSLLPTVPHNPRCDAGCRECRFVLHSKTRCTCPRFLHYKRL